MKITIGKKTLVMGILNITPDSFSDGGIYDTPQKAVSRAKMVLEEGADIIDIGGESTRPGAKQISSEEEIKRVIPVIKNIRQELGNDFLISVDTYKSDTADQALSAGANIVNSMGGFQIDEKLIKVIKKHTCQIIVYHIQGTPKTMQQTASEQSDIMQELSEFFNDQINLGLNAGLSRNQFLIDPGIGFGKTVSQNLEIVRKLETLENFKFPIVIGVSRKNHLGEILKVALKKKGVGPLERLEGALAETAVAVLNGASIVRTHDVLQTKKFLAVLDEVKTDEN